MQICEIMCPSCPYFGLPIIVFCFINCCTFSETLGSYMGGLYERFVLPLPSYHSGVNYMIEIGSLSDHTVFKNYTVISLGSVK